MCGCVECCSLLLYSSAHALLLPLLPTALVSRLQAELQYLARAGAREDYLLLQALSHPAPHELTLFGGAHVLPLYPDPSAK